MSAPSRVGLDQLGSGLAAGRQERGMRYLVTTRLHADSLAPRTQPGQIRVSVVAPNQATAALAGPKRKVLA